jgi:predicted XRE-type DNA-binding protein
MRAKYNKTYEGKAVHTGSGNIFADLGLLPNAEKRLVKAQLVTRSAEVITTRNLTQTQANMLLGRFQAKVSKLVRGRLPYLKFSYLKDQSHSAK